MKKQIENLINNAIDDFNSKWQSHEERNTGVSEYAEKIVNFISSNPVLADSKPRHCPECNSTNVIMFDSDNDLCNDCGAYFC